VLAEFSESAPAYAVWSQDFEIDFIAENVWLIRYKSAHIDGAGSLSRHVLRASLWQRMESGWQMRFHQGTFAPPFDKQESAA
jgi:hypothetical protein